MNRGDGEIEREKKKKGLVWETVVPFVLDPTSLAGPDRVSSRVL